MFFFSLFFDFSIAEKSRENFFWLYEKFIMNLRYKLFWSKLFRDLIWEKNADEDESRSQATWTRVSGKFSSRKFVFLYVNLRSWERRRGIETFCHAFKKVFLEQQKVHKIRTLYLNKVQWSILKVLSFLCLDVKLITRSQIICNNLFRRIQETNAN